MTEKKPTLEYARPQRPRAGYLVLYWHLYAPFVIVLLALCAFLSWGGRTARE